MRQSSKRSLVLTLTVMMTAVIAIASPVRTQPMQSSTPKVETSPKILSQVKPEITSGKKASVVRMFEDIAIAPSFSPTAIELRGISGGGVETQTTSGRKTTETGDCIGFIDADSDHKITLTRPFQYLKLQVKSSGDTILLLRGPGGSWCSDDVSDRNPEISGDWLEGTYEVWVGSYEKNTSFPYLLQITETP